MKHIFLSYRRDDSAGMAGRLYDSLSARFGQERVFFDVDTLKGGEEFAAEIEVCPKKSGVLLVVVGSRWNDILIERSGWPELDYVALEIETAAKLNITVLPILVDKRAKAQFDRFVASNHPLAPVVAKRQVVEIDPGKDYRVHIDRMIRDIEQLLGFRQRRLQRRLLVTVLLFIMLAAGWVAAQINFDRTYHGLPQQALAVGLSGIEDRNDPERVLPPEVIFRKATSEVFLSGVSCYRTFDQHRDVVNEVVSSGKHLFVLLMDPDSPDVREMSARLNKPVGKEIKQVLAIIANNPLLKGKVQIRLMSRLPPFTAVMIDGNVTGSGDGVTSSSEIRVQQLVTHQVQHKGVILVFNPDATTKVKGFNLYADDLRQQWQDAAGSLTRVDEIIRAEVN